MLPKKERVIGSKMTMQQMMTSRQRVIAAIEHREPDKVPFDLGSVGCAGISVETIVRLREAIGLAPNSPKVVECYGMMGEIAPDLHDWMELDVIGLLGRSSMFGFPNDNWKEWTMPNGQTVLVPGLFNTIPESDGCIYQYPQGDRSVPPSAKMPPNGFYFDSIIRQYPIDEDALNPADNASDYSVVTDEELAYMQQEAEKLCRDTDKAIIAPVPGTAFGDVAFVPGPWVKDPKGIRDLEEWYMSLYARKNYIFDTFSMQCETALKNLELAFQVYGDNVQIIMVSGTDFGTQNAPFIGNDVYNELFKPFNKKVNDWIHDNTNWKTFQHCCGSIEPLIPEFIDAGFDILNPLQFTAVNMDPAVLKEKYGRQICFWGGGLDTQKVLPFGTAEEVKEQTAKQVRLLKQGGGFVFTPVHNIQSGTPVENIIAMIEAFKEVR